MHRNTLVTDATLRESSSCPALPVVILGIIFVRSCPGAWCARDEPVCWTRCRSDDVAICQPTQSGLAAVEVATAIPTAPMLQGIGSALLCWCATCAWVAKGKENQRTQPPPSGSRHKIPATKNWGDSDEIQDRHCFGLEQRVHPDPSSGRESG